MYGDKKAIFRHYKEYIHQFISVVNLDVFVWFMKAKVCKVGSCTVYFHKLTGGGRRRLRGLHLKIRVRVIHITTKLFHVVSP